MTQANTLSAGAAAIVLSLGVAGQGTIPKELQIPSQIFCSRILQATMVKVLELVALGQGSATRPMHLLICSSSESSRLVDAVADRPALGRCRLKFLLSECRH